MSAKSNWIIVGLISSAMGVISGGLTAQRLLKNPLDRLNLTTPVFVLDRARLIQGLPPNASPEQMARTVAEWKALAKKLSAEGYLVLDASAIIEAPEDVYVKPLGP